MRGCTNSPNDKSTRSLIFPFVTLIWTTTLLSSREISSVPSSRLLKRRSPSGFHVRNWKLTDIVLWLARPGNWRKLVALKKTGNVWVSIHEKVKLRCEDRYKRHTTGGSMAWKKVRKNRATLLTIQRKFKFPNTSKITFLFPLWFKPTLAWVYLLLFLTKAWFKDPPCLCSSQKRHFLSHRVFETRAKQQLRVLF